MKKFAAENKYFNYKKIGYILIICPKKFKIIIFNIDIKFNVITDLI